MTAIAEVPTAATAAPVSRRHWLALCAVVAGAFVTTLDNTIVNVALPSIQRDLHLGLAGVAWVVNAYILSFAALLLTGGRLADSFGRRRTFSTGLIIFTLASFVGGLAPSFGVLVAARAVQGVGAALLTPPTLAIIRHTFRDEKAHGTAIGIWGSAGAAALAVGPLLGGILTQHLNWHWVFWVNVPLGALGVLAARRFIPESTDPAATRRVDIVGLVLATGALFSLTYALINANDRGWTSPLIDALFGAAAFAGIGFVLVERRVRQPLVDPTLFQSRAFTGANVVALIVNLAAFGVFLFTSLFLQNVLGHSPVRAGAALLPWVAMLLAVAPITGNLAQRIPARHLVAAGLALLGTGLLLLAGVDEHSGYLALLPGLLVGGLGAALTIPVSAIALTAVDVDRAGIASGVLNTARETGGSLGIALTGAVLAYGQHHALDRGDSALHAFATGYSDGLVVAGVITVAAAALALAALRPGRNASTGTPVVADAA
jgi:EmrB/QacA subfamily drug resistance transporter